MIHPVGTGPQNLLSSDSPRLSPIMNQCPAGILIGVGKLHSGLDAAFADVGVLLAHELVCRRLR